MAKSSRVTGTGKHSHSQPQERNVKKKKMLHHHQSTNSPSNSRPIDDSVVTKCIVSCLLGTTGGGSDVDGGATGMRPNKLRKVVCKRVPGATWTQFARCLDDAVASGSVVASRVNNSDEGVGERVLSLAPPSGGGDHGGGDGRGRRDEKNGRGKDGRGPSEGKESGKDRRGKSAGEAAEDAFGGAGATNGGSDDLGRFRGSRGRAAMDDADDDDDGDRSRGDGTTTPTTLEVKVPPAVALHLTRRGRLKLNNIEKNTKTSIVILGWGRNKDAADEKKTKSSHESKGGENDEEEELLTVKIVARPDMKGKKRDGGNGNDGDVEAARTTARDPTRSPAGDGARGAQERQVRFAASLINKIVYSYRKQPDHFVFAGRERCASASSEDDGGGGEERRLPRHGRSGADDARRKKKRKRTKWY